MRPPPERGLTVRAEGTGFHVRAWPQPPLPWGRWALGGLLLGGVGAGLTLATADSGGARVEVLLAILAFGALLALVSHASGWWPVELQVEEQQVYWNGDRFPTDRVTGASASGQTLTLLGREGPLAHARDLPPEVASWIADAINEALSGRE